MSRPRKQVVDYFPHFVSQGKTMFIIEQSFGNDGYAFWFKLLEVLASTDGHFYDMNSDENAEFLMAKTRLSGVSVTEILDKLAKLDAIDSDLWSEKIIWSQNFIRNLLPVYGKRASEIPQKPEFPSRKSQTTAVSVTEIPQIEVSGVENPQRKGKERKVKERRVKESEYTLTLGSMENVRLTPEEYNKLSTDFPDTADEAIEFLSLYIDEKGDRSKAATHNATIRRWVIDAVNERRDRKNSFQKKSAPSRAGRWEKYCEQDGTFETVFDDRH